MVEITVNPSCPPEDQVMVEEPQSSYYYWPVLSFDTFPRRQYHFHHQFQGAKPSRERNNFFKGLKWSSDGSWFLTSTDDNTLQRFELPSDAAEDVSEVDLTTSPEGERSSKKDCKPDSKDALLQLGTLKISRKNDHELNLCHLYRSTDSFRSSLTFQEGEAVYDYCWYPKMTASDPGSCVFVTTSRDHPVHLWDATTGELRCTYRAFDAMDEITAAYSMCFNPSGTKLYCGYKKMLRVFDTLRPGREFSQHSTLTDAKDGQAGIISCLAFNPSNEGLLAAGSYNRTTALYSEDTLEMLFVLHGQQGGVTQVMFSKDGNFLYTGARKDPDILCWDIRNTVSTVYKLRRVTADTNQRITFDIEPNGGHLGTGGQDGLVHIYDLHTGAWVNSFQAAVDTVNSFGFHPSLPLAATASGHRRFQSSADDEDDDSHRSCLKVDENCASVWRFACSWLCSQSSSLEDCLASTEQASEDQSSIPNEDLNSTDFQPMQ